MDLNKVEKYLTEETFKEGKFQIHIMKRTEKGKTFGEYIIKASGGALRFTIFEVEDLRKALDRISHFDYRWRQKSGLDYEV